MKSKAEALEAPALTQLDPEEFSTLVQEPENGGPVVTLLLPMERRGAETRKNPIQLKNALSEASDLLESAGPGTDGLTQQFKSLEKLTTPRAEFWQHQSNGLVLAIDADSIRCWRVPFRPSRTVHVGSRPALGHLLRLTNPRRLRFLVLDLSHTQLIEARPQSSDELGFGVDNLGLGDAPASLAEAMRYDDPERSLQQRAAPAPAKGAQGTAMYHGHGVTGDEEQERRIRRFFEMIDAALAPRLAEDGIPLILFGPESECGLYRQVNSYQKLEDDEIHFNPSALTDRDLHRKLCRKVADRSDAALRRLIEACRAAEAAGRASSDLRELLGATVQGRLDTVLIAPAEPIYGKFDRETGEVEIHPERQPGDENLLEALATHAALQGAEVRFLDGASDGLPENAVAEGIFRF